MDGMPHRVRRTTGTDESTPFEKAADKTNNRVLPISTRPYPRRETLESVISSGVRLEDNELGKILRALDDLANIAKSKRFDATAIDEALKKAAVWAVKQSLLDREIRSLAITDELTGFFNRRGFMAAATQQLKLAHRDQQNVLLLFCDVDHLKAINDSLGHKEGDLALIRTADALEETFRNSDVLARLGGDEFAVLVWEASIPDLRTILGRLDRHFAKMNAEEERYKLSLSIGVARYDPQSPLSLGELLARADHDMYKHKNRRAYAASGPGN
jgi:diguanylate cyclase (GGDEF)-like protein